MTAPAPETIADGAWPGGWESTRRRSRDRWRDGWDREEDRCPPDPKGRACPDPKGWRELGSIGGEEWRELHDRRRQVVRSLRRAGYVARHRWARRQDGTRKAGKAEVPKMTYTEGPARDREAVDPWKLAKCLNNCAMSWVAQARLTSSAELRVVGLPRRCSRVHLCPVCAGAGSRKLGGAMRLVIADQVRTGAIAPDDELYLVTLTQRATEGRTLYDELERLRDGWRRMTTGRPGRAWKARVASSFYGIEVTRGSEGKRGKLGRWWHVHMHVVVHVRAEFVADFRAWLSDRWLASSEGAAELAGLPQSAGWSPVAGCEDWIKRIDPTDPKAVYQACKYPTPAVELHPVALAEFVAVAHQRRWHDGRGGWRGIGKLADELDELDNQADAPADDQAYDVGAGVVDLGPDAPSLDQVDNAIGRESSPAEESRANSSLAEVCWRLCAGVDLVAIAAAVRRIGGDIHGPPASPNSRDYTISVPIAAARRLVADWDQATRAKRRKIEPPSG